MVPFLVISAVSLVFVLVTCWFAYGRSGTAGVIWFSLAMAVTSFFLLMPVTFVQAAATFLVAIVQRMMNARPRSVALGSVAVAASMLGILAAIGISNVLEANRYRAVYPLLSVEDRLDYERAAPLVGEGQLVGPPKTLTSAAQQRLEEQDHINSLGHRELALSRLHEQTSDAFVNVNLMFGAVRMLRVPLSAIDLPEERPIPVPEPPSPTPSESPGDALSGGAKQAVAPRADGSQALDEIFQPLAAPTPAGEAAALPDETLLALHVGGTHDFLDRNRTGYVAARRRVAGFIPHRFTHVPRPGMDRTNSGEWVPPHSWTGRAPATVHWQVTRLELVSLLKYPEPRVYVSRHLPRMDELGQAATRPLNDFESSSLDRLRDGEDLISESAHNRIYLLGSLRASKTCLECHDVGHGALLGAFSYDLDRQPPGAVPKTPPPDRL